MGEMSRCDRLDPRHVHLMMDLLLARTRDLHRLEVARDPVRALVTAGARETQ